MIVDNNPEEFDIRRRNRSILTVTIGSAVVIVVAILLYQSVLPYLPIGEDKLENTETPLLITVDDFFHNGDAQEEKSKDNEETGDIVQPTLEKQVAQKNEIIVNQPSVQTQIKIKQTNPQSSKQPKINENNDNAVISYIIKKGQSFWSVVSDLGTEDPWRWKFLLKQNEDKVQSVIFNVNKNKWQVNINPGTTLSYDPQFQFDQKPIKTRKYAFQLISLEEKYEEKAVEITRELINKGYYAYLYKTKRRIYSPALGRSVYFNRVRVGFFNDEETARETAEEIINKNIIDLDSDDYFIVVPSKSELQGNKNDLGIQNTASYAIQISNFTAKQQAVQQYQSTLGFATFGYISQLRLNGVTYYRNRVGFFESRKEANQALREVRKQFKKARVIKVANIFESALGQNLGRKAFDLIK